MCLAQGHNTVTPVRLEPPALALESSTLPLCSPYGLDQEKTLICSQQRHRPAWAFSQSDQHLYYCLSGKYNNKLVMCKISIFWLVSVAEQASFEQYLVINLGDGFSRTMALTRVPLFRDADKNV